MEHASCGFSQTQNRPLVLYEVESAKTYRENKAAGRSRAGVKKNSWRGSLKRIREAIAEQRLWRITFRLEFFERIDFYLELAERYGKEECRADLLNLRDDIGE